MKRLDAIICLSLSLALLDGGGCRRHHHRLPAAAPISYYPGDAPSGYEPTTWMTWEEHVRSGNGMVEDMPGDFQEFEELPGTDPVIVRLPPPSLKEDQRPQAAWSPD